MDLLRLPLLLPLLLRLLHRFQVTVTVLQEAATIQTPQMAILIAMRNLWEVVERVDVILIRSRGNQSAIRPPLVRKHRVSRDASIKPGATPDSAVEMTVILLQIAEATCAEMLGVEVVSVR